MTPEDIELALEQPEFNNPLKALARARIAAETAMDEYREALNVPFDVEDQATAMEQWDMLEDDYFEDFSNPFMLDVYADVTEEELVKKYYLSIKANLLKPENRMKEAVK